MLKMLYNENCIKFVVFNESLLVFITQLIYIYIYLFVVFLCFVTHGYFKTKLQYIINNYFNILFNNTSKYFTVISALQTHLQEIAQTNFISA